LPRKPADVAHINFRIREHLRRKLETEAKRHQVSLNSEMHSRLEASFEAETTRYLEMLASKIEAAWLRLGGIQQLLAWGDMMADGIDRENVGPNALSQVASHWRETRVAANQHGRLDETLSGEPKS
jgi:hypothetical protein